MVNGPDRYTNNFKASELNWARFRIRIVKFATLMEIQNLLNRIVLRKNKHLQRDNPIYQSNFEPRKSYNVIFGSDKSLMMQSIQSLRKIMHFVSYNIQINYDH